MPDRNGHDGLRVVVVEDHPLFRSALTDLVRSDPGTAAVTAYGSLEAFLAAQPVDVDVVVLDLGLPGVQGGEAVAAARDHARGVLAMSGQEEERGVVEALRAGADGFTAKTAPPDEFLSAVRAVAGGGSWLSSSVGGGVLRALTAPVAQPAGHGLSPREREVLALLAAGRTDRAIAAELYVTLATVRSHLDRIREKTGCRRRAELTRLALSDESLAPAVRAQQTTGVPAPGRA
jgi:DNA-binding NarL/FixJ family response regulator